MENAARRWTSAVLAIGMLFSLSGGASAEAASAKLKTKKMSLTVGKSATIKIRNKARKRTYLFKSNKKKVATVNKKGKVKAKKAGSAYITVKEKNKKKTRTLGKVKVTVKKKPKMEPDGQTAKPTDAGGAAATNSAAPSAVSTSTENVVPTSTAEPVLSPTPVPTPVPAPGAPFTESYNTSDGKLCGNPLVTTRYIADPTCIEYKGRLYVYGTADYPQFKEDGTVKENGYNTTTLACISTEDMVNWRDEGLIETGTRSWAPSITSKVIDGKEQFFLYFANGTGGIKELTSDSPTGPWKQATAGEYLINREILMDYPKEEYDTFRPLPTWIFDPGVMKTEDGEYYLAFGGSSNTVEFPKNTLIVKLGEDMCSLGGVPKKLNAPWSFEDNELNQINGKYYYSYCTTWSCPDEGAGIGYMVSDSPMGPYEYKGIVLKNPGEYFGLSYNNHHHMFEYKDQWYILYHTTVLEDRQYGTQGGYRSLHVDKLNVGEDGALSSEGTNEGVQSVMNLNPYQETNATTMAWCGGLTTSQSESMSQMVVDSISDNDWLGVSQVDFGADGASDIAMKLAASGKGTVEIHLDSADGKKVGEIAVSATGDEDTYTEVTAPLLEKTTGVHNLFFVFHGEGYRVLSWKFS